MVSFAGNPAFIEEERLTCQLHELNNRGLGESPEAEAIQEADEAWEHLNAAERQRIHQLSADLHMLTDSEIHEPTDLSQEQLKEQLQAAWTKNDALTMLSLLRKGPACLSADKIAYFRWKYYRALGQLETAHLFILDAARRTPEDYFYKECVLSSLTETRRLSEAISLAQQYCDSSFHPYLRIFAASELFEWALEGQLPVPLESIAATLEAALKDERSKPNQEMRGLGLICLGFLYARLGHPYKAQLKFSEAGLQQIPNKPSDVISAQMHKAVVEQEPSVAVA